MANGKQVRLIWITMQTSKNYGTLSAVLDVIARDTRVERVVQLKGRGGRGQVSTKYLTDKEAFQLQVDLRKITGVTVGEIHIVEDQRTKMY